MVLEWTAIHQGELLENWNRLHNDQAPQRIDPLDKESVRCSHEFPAFAI